MFDVAAHGCLQVLKNVEEETRVLGNLNARREPGLVRLQAAKKKWNPPNFGQIVTSEACFGHCRHLLSMYHHQIITKST